MALLKEQSDWRCARSRNHAPLAIACGTLRLVGEDAELDGYLFPRHDGRRDTAAANRDPTIYQDPDRVDITREDAPAILTFGAARTTAWAPTWPGARLPSTDRPRPTAGEPAYRRPAPWKPMLT